MKKPLLFSFLVLLLFIPHALAQVGINTANPQATLHVDGQKDNPAIGAPSTTQQLNDIVITPSGNVGVGTVTPSTKLEIASGINGVSGLKFSNTSIKNILLTIRV